MKVTNKQVVDSVQSLNQLSDEKLPVKTAFKVAKIARKLETIVSDYNKVLSKLQDEHVDRDEDGSPKTVDDPNDPNVKRLLFKDSKAFSEAYQELLDLETDVDITKLKVEDLGSIEVTPSTLYPIEWLIED